jgi:lipopolysaccharide export system protein LptA
MRLQTERRLFCVLLLLLLGGFSLAQVGQQREPVVRQVTATNPKYPEFFDPPFQSQLKSLVQGSKAESLSNSRLQVYDAKVQDFETNGQTKLIIQTPRCIYDRPAHAVSSSEPLHVQTGDGKFMTDGTGFLFVQTNGLLFISNRVHTFVQADLLRPTSTNADSGSAPKIGDLEIASERLIFETNGLARYIGDAHVSSTNLSLKGGSILIVAPTKQKQLESVTVETNVVMDYENIHVQGQHAIYTGDNGIARVTGNPQWRSEDRNGHGDELVVDTTNRIFRANGNAFLQFSTANLGFLPTQALGSTNAKTSTNHLVQITSDFYEIHTNHAQFGDHVMMWHLPAQTNCSL